MINSSARIISILIGTENWSAWQSGFETGYVYISESGISAIQAKLTLKFDLNDPTLPSIPDFERNPNQWAKGQSVTVQVANDSNTLINHPCGKLFIIGEPRSPNRFQSSIELDLGCQLVLESYPVPDRDKSGATTGAVNPSRAIIENYLTEAGLTHSLTAIPFPLNRPIAKTDGGSWIELAGKIARERGHTLYIDSAGTVRNAEINLDVASPILSFTYGGDYGNSIEFTKNQGTEFPVEKIIASGTCPEISTVDAPEVFTIINKTTRGALTKNPALINPSSFALEINLVTTITVYPFNGAFERTTTEVTLPLIAVSDQFATAANFLLSMRALLQEDLKYYDEQSRLTKTTKQIICPLTAITKNPLFVSQASYLLEEEKSFETETITYDTDGVISSILNELEEAQIVITDDIQITNISNYLLLRDRSSRRQSWKKLALKKYLTTIEEREATVIADPDIATFINAFRLVLSASPESITANNGSTNPPATQTRSDATLEEKAFSSDIFFKPLAGAQFYERQRAYVLSYLGDTATAVDQLMAYGTLQNKFITGLRLGRTLIIPLSNALLANCKPAMQLQMTDSDGWIYKLVLNSITFTHNQTDAIALLNCITIGIIDPASPSVIRNPITLIGALQATFTQVSNSSAVFQSTPVLAATFTQVSNSSATFINWIPFTAIANEAYIYNSTDGGQTLDKIYDSNLTTSGALRLDAGGTPDLFLFHVALQSSQVVTSINFWLGQFNGPFNKPNQIEIYDGVDDTGTLLGTISSTIYGLNEYDCSIDSPNWDNAVTDICFKCTLFDSAFNECAILEIRIYA